ncbi:hypothetical protein C8Q77DRAFT_1056901 [Trametes polyzona]|nr:hypothetical protein C8Q77DRAFT_1056901 [Trametes polyzona]
MQLRLPLWYVLVLLWAFLLKGRAAPVCRTSNRVRDDDDDSDSDDDDDDDDDRNQHHRACATLGSGGGKSISKGAVAGIVIGCLLILLLIILLACWCVRRRRSRSRQPINLAVAAAPAPPVKELPPSRRNGEHPTSALPHSMAEHPPVNLVPAVATLSDSMGRRHARELHNIPPAIAESSESISLPNPYEQDTPPTPPPHDEVISPSTTMSRYASLYSTASPTEHSYSHSRSYSYSAAPSAWTHDDSAVPLLSRGTTQTSRLTASSSLHEEMAGYQKALEAHHRKEQDDAQRREDRIGEGSAFPEDPPPVYRDREELL